MNKLIIDQEYTDTPIEVTPNVVYKLTEVSRETDNVSLTGNLKTLYAYREDAEYLNSKFTLNFNLRVTDEYYVNFRDDIVKNYFIGDLCGVTKTYLNDNYTLLRMFKDNKDIRIADFAAFRNISRTNNSFDGVSLNGCDTLEEIYVGKLMDPIQLNKPFLGPGTHTYNKIIIGECGGITGTGSGYAKNVNVNTYAIGGLQDPTSSSFFNADFAFFNLHIENFYLNSSIVPALHSNITNHITSIYGIENLYVPIGSREDYNTNWKEYLNNATGKEVIGNIIEYDFENDPNGIFDVLDMSYTLV